MIMKYVLGYLLIGSYAGTYLALAAETQGSIGRGVPPQGTPLAGISRFTLAEYSPCFGQ